jgi:hypothetical protein
MVRSADLVVRAKVAELRDCEIETAMGTKAALARGRRATRLARLEIVEVWKGTRPTHELWMLAEPDFAGYQLQLESAGAEAIVFLSRGELTDPLHEQYLAGTDTLLWRAVASQAGFAPIQSEELRLPAWSFGPEDAELSALERGSDGRVLRVALAPLKTSVLRWVAEQAGPWAKLSAQGKRGEFAWKLRLDKNRHYLLEIERARGIESVEGHINARLARELEAFLARPREFQVPAVLGAAHAGQLERSLEIVGGPSLQLRTLDFEQMNDPDFAAAARWALGLYALLRSSTQEAGLMDGRIEDRRFVR